MQGDIQELVDGLCIAAREDMLKAEAL